MLLTQVFGWLSAEPLAACLLIVAAAGIFVVRWQKPLQPVAGVAQPWARRALAGAVGMVLFLGLIWGFQAVLNNTALAFQSTHGGAISDSTRFYIAEYLWGSSIEQSGLHVEQFGNGEVIEQTPRENPDLPPVYHTIIDRKLISQDCITGFQGFVNMQLIESQMDGAIIRGYSIDVSLDYTIVNDSPMEAETVFDLYLPSQVDYPDLSIRVDDQDVFPDQNYGSAGWEHWMIKMNPRQKSMVKLHYSGAGRDSFIFYIPATRPINNSQLILSVDQVPVERLAYPDGVVAPTEIRPTPDKLGSILTWRFDQATIYPRMGISLPRAEQKDALTLSVLLLSPFSASLLGALLVLTIVLWGKQVRLLDLTGYLAAYSLQFLLVAALADQFFGYWSTQVAGTLITLLLSFYWSGKLPIPGLRWLLFGLAALFSILVPLACVLSRPEQQNALQIFLQAGSVLYLTGLWVYTHRKSATLPVSG